MKATTDDLLDALREAMTPDVGAEDAFTGPELEARMGSRYRTKAALRGLLVAGRAEVVTVRRQAIDGRLMTLKGYRLKR